MTTWFYKCAEQCPELFDSAEEFLSDYEKNIVRYLAEELNLYADLCYGRNYVCIEKVRSLFPLDHLIYHISNIELHEEILSGLINILNYVYILTFPLYNKFLQIKKADFLSAFSFVIFLQYPPHQRYNPLLHPYNQRIHP